MIFCPFQSPALTEHSCRKHFNLTPTPNLQTAHSSHPLFLLTISLTMGCLHTRCGLLSNIINYSNDQSTHVTSAD